jgi:hypothetical protein
MPSSNMSNSNGITSNGIADHGPAGPIATSSAMASPNMNSRPAAELRNASLRTSTRTSSTSSTITSTTSNNYELALKLTGDVAVATTITFGIAPFLSVIDKAIVQKAAGTHSIVQSSLESVVQVVKSPLTFVRSPVFLMMWGVYAATYTTANCLKTLTEHNEQKRVEQIEQEYQYHRNPNPNQSKSATTITNSNMIQFGVFATTTAINSSTTMLKDKYYAKHFGTAASKLKVPMITYGLWGLRDCMVIGSSFILPDVMCGMLQESSNGALDKGTALRISQFACPVVAQFVAGPIQLLGLDIYNRPLKNTNMTFQHRITERVRFQVQNFTAIVGARIARIAPAYGVGGIGNTYLRDQWRARVVRGSYLLVVSC